MRVYTVFNIITGEVIASTSRRLIKSQKGKGWVFRRSHEFNQHIAREFKEDRKR